MSCDTNGEIWYLTGNWSYAWLILWGRFHGNFVFCYLFINGIEEVFWQVLRVIDTPVVSDEFQLGHLSPDLSDIVDKEQRKLFSSHKEWVSQLTRSTGRRGHARFALRSRDPHFDLIVSNFIVNGTQKVLRKVFWVIYTAVHFDVLFLCHLASHLQRSEV